MSDVPRPGRVAMAATLVALLCACTGADSGISRQLAKRYAAGADPIDLSRLGPASWQRVCVLSPYSTNQRAEQVLGFKWDAEANTRIATNDGITVLVFVRDAQVVAYAEHPRNQGDLSTLTPRCLERTSAKIVRRTAPSGWIQLVAQGAP